jgi:hypothetical protein
MGAPMDRLYLVVLMIGVFGALLCWLAAYEVIASRSESTPPYPLANFLGSVGLGLVWLGAWAGGAETLSSHDALRRLRRGILVDAVVERYTAGWPLPVVRYAPAGEATTVACLRLSQLRNAESFYPEVGDTIEVRYDPQRPTWVAIDRPEFELKDALSRVHFRHAIFAIVGTLLVVCGIAQVI